MDAALVPLFWLGIVGWVLLFFLLGLRVSVRDLPGCLVALVPVGIVSNALIAILHRTGIGWRFAVFFVALPYLLSLVRWWRLRARRLASVLPPTHPSPNNALQRTGIGGRAFSDRAA